MILTTGNAVIDDETIQSVNNNYERVIAKLPELDFRLKCAGMIIGALALYDVDKEQEFLIDQSYKAIDELKAMVDDTVNILRSTTAS